MRGLAFNLLGLLALISNRASPQGVAPPAASPLPTGRWVTSELSAALSRWVAVLPKGSTDRLQVCVVTEAFNSMVAVFETVGSTPSGGLQLASTYTLLNYLTQLGSRARDFFGDRPAGDTILVVILSERSGGQRGPYQIHFAGPPPAMQLDSVGSGRVESCRPSSIWEFVGNGGDSLSVEVASPSFAVRLELQDSTAGRLAQQDASGVGRVALLAYRLSYSGRSRSQARGWGPYSLRARVER
jgi:hypothetical protein